MPEPNPFPLEIANKSDSFEKQQLMANVPENYKYSAEEYNKILSALKYLSENLSGSPIWGAITGLLTDQQDLIDYINNIATVSNQADNVLNSAYEWVQDYTFKILFVKFIKDGVIEIITFNQEKTLAAGDPNDRYDIIAFNLETEIIEIVPGTAAPDPAFPALTENQKQITVVFIKANSTEPENAEYLPVYDDNLQEVGGEFDTSTNAPANITLDDTDNSSSGTKSIKFNLAANNNRVDLDVATPLNGGSYSHLRLDILLENNVNHNIRFQFRTQSPASGSNTINIYHNRYGLDKNNTTTWQTILIPISAFAIVGYNFDRLRIQNKRASASFRLDKIGLISGLEDAANQNGDYLLKGGYDGTAQDIIDLIIAAGGGDMLAANNLSDVASAATSRTNLGIDTTANQSDSADKRFMTDAQEAKVDHISVTQAVDLDQMETDIAALVNGMVYKDDWDASSGSFPGSGSAKIGWFYNVSVAGTIDSVEFAIGDSIIAKVDNASISTYVLNWVKKDQTDAVQNVAGEVGTISKSSLLAALNVEDGADVTDAENVEDAITSTSADTLTDTSVLPFVKAAVLVKITWANLKATLKTYQDTLYVVVADFLEEKLNGTATENLTMTGAVNVSLNTAAHSNFKLTGNATITITDTPASGKTVTRTYKVRSTATETLGVANSTAEYGAYVADTTETLMTVMASNTATDGLEIHVFFSQPN